MKSGSGNVNKGTRYMLVGNCSSTRRVQFYLNELYQTEGSILAEGSWYAHKFENYQDAVSVNNSLFHGLMSIVREDSESIFDPFIRFNRPLYPSKSSKHKFQLAVS